MSMLAEPRRRTKYSIDPRGDRWSKDETKFGVKLMEKMGWSKGKGLGANEDGNVEHVAVEVKNDQLGVGCTKNHADNWIAHQDDFNALLSSLNVDNTDSAANSASEEKFSNLEHKSKSSKGRVHYMKFAKGKDLSMKKAEELDCIFGRRKIKSNLSTPLTQSTINTPGGSNNDDTKDECGDAMDKAHGVTTVKNQLSVGDYFAKKMAAMQSKLGLRNSDTASDTATCIDTTSAVCDSQDGAMGVADDKVGDNKTNKKNKAERKSSRKDKEIEDTSDLQNLEISNSDSKNKKKKSKKDKNRTKEFETETNTVEENGSPKAKRQEKDTNAKQDLEPYNTGNEILRGEKDDSNPVDNLKLVDDVELSDKGNKAKKSKKDEKSTKDKHIIVESANVEGKCETDNTKSQDLKEVAKTSKKATKRRRSKDKDHSTEADASKKRKKTKESKSDTIDGTEAKFSKRQQRRANTTKWTAKALLKPEAKQTTNADKSKGSRLRNPEAQPTTNVYELRGHTPLQTSNVKELKESTQPRSEAQMRKSITAVNFKNIVRMKTSINKVAPLDPVVIMKRENGFDGSTLGEVSGYADGIPETMHSKQWRN